MTSGRTEVCITLQTEKAIQPRLRTWTTTNYLSKVILERVLIGLGPVPRAGRAWQPAPVLRGVWGVVLGPVRARSSTGPGPGRGRGRSGAGRAWQSRIGPVRGRAGAGLGAGRGQACLAGAGNLAIPVYVANTAHLCAARVRGIKNRKLEYIR
jgi:hypothetical protein